MPQLAPVIIASLIGAGTTVGTALFQHFTQPSAPAGPTPEEMTKSAVSDEESRRQGATKQAAQFLPQLQADTSGGLSPDAYKDLAANFSGNANLADSPQMKQLVAKFLGLDTGAAFGGSEPFGSSSGGSNPLATGLAA